MIARKEWLGCGHDTSPMLDIPESTPVWAQCILFIFIYVYIYIYKNIPHRGIIIMKLLNKTFSKTYAFHPYLNYSQTNFNKTIFI